MIATAPVNDRRGFMVQPGEMFWTTPDRAMEILAGQWGELLSDDSGARAAVAAFADDHEVVALTEFRARQAISEALSDGLHARSNAALTAAEIGVDAPRWGHLSHER